MKTIESTTEHYLLWLQVERRFAASSIVKYRSILKCFIRDVGNIKIKDFRMEHIFKLKQILYQRNNSEVFIGVTLSCLKGFLKYLRDYQKIRLKINPDEITIPKRPRKEVVFLTKEEIKRFKRSISAKTVCGLRFRTLVEVLLASGMRISEALNLNQNSIDYETMEAKVIGKGNKERAVFFTKESLNWVWRYLERREELKDNNEALFTTTFKWGKNGKREETRRLRNQDLTRYFKRQRIKAGINKKVTPHILRHCFASHLAFNNCPFTEIKTLCGHERLDTTIRYYVGLTDKQKAKEAHRMYLKY